MKSIIIFVSVFLFSTILYGQSISASKIISFLESQNSNTIKSELMTFGFKFRGEKSDYNIFMNSFIKLGNLGKERIEFGKNNELFVVVYRPVSEDYFTILKAKLLTNDFRLVYSLKNNKYYENNYMRIGINEASNILSLFVALKQN